MDVLSALWNDSGNGARDRYVYFPASGERLGLRGASLLEMNRDECKEAGMLAVVKDVMPAAALRRRPSRHWVAAGRSEGGHWAERLPLLQVLLRVHATAFAGDGAPGLSSPSASAAPVDVRSVLEVEQGKVLAGCCLLFSGVIPLQQKPASHRLWQMAKRFGAQCVTVPIPAPASTSPTHSLTAQPCRPVRQRTFRIRARKAALGGSAEVLWAGCVWTLAEARGVGDARHCQSRGD